MRNRSGDSQIISGGFATAAVGDDIEADLLPLIEGAQAGAFDRADMNKHVIAAAGELDEAKTLLAVKPLHDSCIHLDVLSLTIRTSDSSAPRDQERSAPFVG